MTKKSILQNYLSIYSKDEKFLYNYLIYQLQDSTYLLNYTKNKSEDCFKATSISTLFLNFLKKILFLDDLMGRLI